MEQHDQVLWYQWQSDRWIYTHDSEALLPRLAAAMAAGTCLFFSILWYWYQWQLERSSKKHILTGSPPRVWSLSIHCQWQVPDIFDLPLLTIACVTVTTWKIIEEHIYSLAYISDFVAPGPRRVIRFGWTWRSMGGIMCWLDRSSLSFRCEYPVLLISVTTWKIIEEHIYSLVGEGHRDAWHVRVPCLFFFLFKNNSANSEYIENSDWGIRICSIWLKFTNN